MGGCFNNTGATRIIREIGRIQSGVQHLVRDMCKSLLFGKLSLDRERTHLLYEPSAVQSTMVWECHEFFEFVKAEATFF